MSRCSSLAKTRRRIAPFWGGASADLLPVYGHGFRLKRAIVSDFRIHKNDLLFDGRDLVVPRRLRRKDFERFNLPGRSSLRPNFA